MLEYVQNIMKGYGYIKFLVIFRPYLIEIVCM